MIKLTGHRHPQFSGGCELYTTFVKATWLTVSKASLVPLPPGGSLLTSEGNVPFSRGLSLVFLVAPCKLERRMLVSSSEVGSLQAFPLDGERL
jgi:hypothetical protein